MSQPLSKLTSISSQTGEIPAPLTSTNAPIPPERIVLGIALRLGAMAALAIMFAFIKLADREGVHVTESIFWRQLAALPLLISWLWWNNDLVSVKTNNPGKHVVRMMLGLSGMVLNFVAMILLPMANATIIGFAMPIFATVLAALFLKEKTGWYRWSAVIIGFIGVLIAVGFGGKGLSPIGSLLALGGAIATAGVSIQLRNMSKTESTAAIVFWFSLSSLVPLGIAMLFFAGSHAMTAWLYIAGLSIAGAIGQILLTAALRYAPVAVVLTMDYSSLIWATLLGIILFGDIPGANIWLGAAIIIASGLLILWREQYLAKARAR
jgi:drug/metabolite transporter (DMT)-like permease